MEPLDCLIDARWVIPMGPGPAVLADHSVAIRDGRIAAVLPAAQAASRFDPARRVSLTQHALIPGLVNLHTHAAMSLMRGLADDVALMKWLSKHIWPVESKYVSPDFVHDGTLLACAEMLRGGVTCFNDMYFYPEAAARAALAFGMRAAIGIIAIDFPTQYAADPDDYLAKGLAMRDAHREDPLLTYCLAPHAPYTVSNRLFERILTIAEELDLPIHIHVHETRDEIETSLARYNVRPLARLRELGLLGPRLIAVHAVHVTEMEIEMLANHGCSVAHCPSSNLKLASGFAPVAAMLARSINVGLGTDGPASNNRLDMFCEMRAAALLAKATTGNPESLPAHEALRAATINAAKALGLDATIGSIEPGKAADLCAVAFEGPEMAPCYDPISHLVYVAGRENVSDVWVAGKPVVENRQLANFSTLDLDKLAKLWQNKLAGETMS